MLNLFRRWYERHFSQPGTIEFALVLICAFLIVYYLMWLVGPIVVALCIAYCLEWPVQGLQRLTNCGRQLAASVVMVLFCSVVILITVLLIPQIVKQGAEFYNSIISFSLDQNKSATAAPADNNTSPDSGQSINIERTQEGVQVLMPARSGTMPPPQSSLKPIYPQSEQTEQTESKISLPDEPQLLLLSKQTDPESQSPADAADQTVATEILASGDSTAHVNAGATAASSPTRDLFAHPLSKVPDHAIPTTDATISTINGTAHTLLHPVNPVNNAVIEASREQGSEHGKSSTVQPDNATESLAALEVTPALAINPEQINIEVVEKHPQSAQATTQTADNQYSLADKTNGDTSKSVTPVDLSKKGPEDNAELAVKNQEPDKTITVQAISDKSQNLESHNESASIAEEGTSSNGLQIEVSYDNENTFKLTVSDFDTRLAQEAYLVTLNLPEPIPSMLSIDDIKNAVRQVRIQTTAYLAELMRTKLMPSVVNLFTWSVYIIIVPIFTFLMLYNKEQLTKRAVVFVLPNNQVLMRKFWPSLHQQISGYIRGKLLHIIIISIANSIAFKILNVNYALLLGVGVGLSVVIPYVGAVIIAIPVVLVAIFQFGFSESLLWVLAIYTIIQLLDSNVLTPMLFSKAMNLDAFSILAAILIFGGLWGFWGVFFAIPLATFIKTIVMQWPNKDVREQQKKEHLRLINVQKAEKLKQNRV